MVIRQPYKSFMDFHILLSEIKTNQFRFLGNCPPIPPLTQHFALSEKLVLMLT